MPDPVPSSALGRVRRAAYETPAYGPPPRSRSRFLLVGLPLFAVFAAFGSIVWLAYVESAPRTASGEPPLIRAEAEPMKVRPDDPGGRVVADQGELRELIGEEELAGRPERLLPLPEEPVTPAEAPEPEPAEEAPREIETAEAAPPAGAEPGDAASAGEQVAVAPEQAEADAEPADATAGQASETEAQASAALDALLAEVSRPQAAPAEDAAPAAEQPEPQVAPSPNRPAPPAETSPPQPAAQQPQPAEQPQPDAAPRDLAALDPEQVAPPQRAEPVPVVTAPDQQQAAGGNPSYRIQLAAVREEADARRAWNLFQSDLAETLSGLDPIIERADTANGIFYRVQIGPFANLAGAESLCEELKQRNASCFVIRR